ncbi:MAG: Rieske 2Fe-2S domain-containing protein [Gammaproteobacteria bacterium]
MDELPDPGSRGFSVPQPNGVRDIFVVRRGQQVFAYRNCCPHTGGPLDWVPDRFLDLDGAYIQCATHDARFEIGSGRCVAGPCAGDALIPVAVCVEQGSIVLNDPLATD